MRFLLVLMLSSLIACSSKDSLQCDDSNDCADNEVCSSDSVCLTLCNTTNDCPVGMACDATKVCLTPQIDATSVKLDTRFLTTPSLSSNQASTVFTFEGYSAFPLTGYECSLDGKNFAACTTPLNIVSLSEGSHTLKVRAVDFVGNKDETPAAYTWTVDVTPPTIEKGACPPATVVAGTDIAISFRGQDNFTGVSFQCSYVGLSGAWECQSPLTFTAKAGSYTLKIEALDKAGNKSATSIECVWNAS